jgi:hypothetical protein
VTAFSEVTRLDLHFLVSSKDLFDCLSFGVGQDHVKRPNILRPGLRGSGRNLSGGFPRQFNNVFQYK